MPPTIFEWGIEGIKAHAYSGFSDYVQELIRIDKKHRQQLELPLWSARGPHRGTELDGIGHDKK